MSTDPNDYPLVCRGVFAGEARVNFIQLAPRVCLGEPLSPEEKRGISQLAGVCAFTDPLQAYRRGTESTVGRSCLLCRVYWGGVRSSAGRPGSNR